MISVLKEAKISTEANLAAIPAKRKDGASRVLSPFSALRLPLAASRSQNL